MRESKVRHAIPVNQDNEKDFSKLYEDSGCQYYDEGETL